MTNYEAIKSKVGYPLSKNAFYLALENRGLISTDTYTVSNKQLLELAYADLIVTILSSPDVREGGYYVAMNDRRYLINIANGIYQRNGEVCPYIEKPTAKFVQKW